MYTNIKRHRYRLSILYKVTALNQSLPNVIYIVQCIGDFNATVDVPLSK